MWHGHCGHVVIVSICSVLRRMLNRLPVSSAGGKQHFTPESSGRCWLSSNLWRVYCSVQQSDTWGGVVVSEEAGGLACASALTENIFLSSDLIVCVCVCVCVTQWKVVLRWTHSVTLQTKAGQIDTEYTAWAMRHSGSRPIHTNVCMLHSLHPPLCESFWCDEGWDFAPALIRLLRWYQGWLLANRTSVNR